MEIWGSIVNTVKANLDEAAGLTPSQPAREVPVNGSPPPGTEQGNAASIFTETPEKNQQPAASLTGPDAGAASAADDRPVSSPEPHASTNVTPDTSGSPTGPLPSVSPLAVVATPGVRCEDASTVPSPSIPPTPQQPAAGSDVGGRRAAPPPVVIATAAAAGEVKHSQQQQPQQHEETAAIIAKLTQQLKDQQQQHRTTQQECTQLKSTVQRLQEQLQASEAQVKVSRSDITQLNDKITSLKAQLQTAVNNAQTAAAAAAAAAATTATSSQRSEKEEILFKEGVALSAQLHQEREKIKTLLLERKSGEDQIARLAQECAELQQKMIRCEELKSLAVQSETTSLQRLQAAETSVIQKTQENFELFEKVNSLQTVLQQQQQQSQQTIELCQKQLQERSDQEQKEKEAWEFELSQLRTEMKKSVLEYEARIVELEKSLGMAQLRVSIAESKTMEWSQNASDLSQELQLQNHHLSHQYKTVVESRTKLVKEYESLQQEFSLWKSMNVEVQNTLTQRVQELSAESGTLHHQLHSLKKDLEKETAMRVSTWQRNQSLVEELDRLQVARQRDLERLELYQHQQQQQQQLTTSTSAVFGATSEYPSNHHSEGDASTGSGGNNKGEKYDAGLDMRARARRSIEEQQRKAYEQEVASLKKQLNNLSLQHDTLLQMYGQLMTEGVTPPAPSSTAVVAKETLAGVTVSPVPQ